MMIKAKGEGYSKKSVWKRICPWMLLLGLFAATSIWVNSGERIEYVAEKVVNAVEFREVEFLAIAEKFSVRWQEEMGLLQKDLDAILSKNMQNLRKVVMNPEHFDSFCDEYYGYLKSFKFIYLGAKDLFSSGSPNVNREVRTMVERHFLVGVEGKLDHMYLEMELAVEKRAIRWRQDFQKALEASFTEQEVRELVKRFSGSGIVSAPQMVQFSSRIALDILAGRAIDRWITQKILSNFSMRISRSIFFRGTFQGVRLASTKLISSAASKMFTNILLAVIGGIAVDYLLNQSSRFLTEKKLQRDLRSSLNAYFVSMERDLRKSVVHSMEMIAQQGLGR